MSRGDSICEMGGTIPGLNELLVAEDLRIGQKRQRPDDDDQQSDINKDSHQFLVKESWVSKRPKLDNGEDVNISVPAAVAMNAPQPIDAATAD